jgi:hypothetical protein
MDGDDTAWQWAIFVQREAWVRKSCVSIPINMFLPLWFTLGSHMALDRSHTNLFAGGMCIHFLGKQPYMHSLCGNRSTRCLRTSILEFVQYGTRIVCLGMEKGSKTYRGAIHRVRLPARARRIQGTAEFVWRCLFCGVGKWLEDSCCSSVDDDIRSLCYSHIL